MVFYPVVLLLLIKAMRWPYTCAMKYVGDFLATAEGVMSTSILVSLFCILPVSLSLFSLLFFRVALDLWAEE